MHSGQRILMRIPSRESVLLATVVGGVLAVLWSVSRRRGRKRVLVVGSVNVDLFKKMGGAR